MNCFGNFAVPDAKAEIFGSNEYPDIYGNLRFFRVKHGVMVHTKIIGLPMGESRCKQPVFAFHIHNGVSCSGNAEDSFADAGNHYNPHDCPHPYHAGDLPPLFGVDGMAVSCVLTNRFTIEEIAEKAVIIHLGADDFKTQPSGDSGKKIACGIIKSLR